MVSPRQVRIPSLYLLLTRPDLHRPQRENTYRPRLSILPRDYTTRCDSEKRSFKLPCQFLKLDSITGTFSDAGPYSSPSSWIFCDIHGNLQRRSVRSTGPSGECAIPLQSFRVRISLMIVLIGSKAFSQGKRRGEGSSRQPHRGTDALPFKFHLMCTQILLRNQSLRLQNSTKSTRTFGSK